MFSSFINDLLSTDPELAAEWNYDKNLKGPDEYRRTSMYSVWWKGACGHEWSDKIYSRAIHKKDAKGVRQKCHWMISENCFLK